MCANTLYTEVYEKNIEVQQMTPQLARDDNKKT